MAQNQLFKNENLKKSTFDPKIDLYKDGKPLGGFYLPGYGDPYASCGDFYSKGCLNVDGHKQALLDADSVGKAFIKRMVSTCLRASCPTCYEKWAGKEAHAIDYRLKEAKKGRLYFGKVIHVPISVPEKDYYLVESDYPKLRRKVYKLLKRVGLFGGSCIFHPYRVNKSTKKWYFSPHFHILGYGWIRGKKVTAVYRDTGYIIKNLGVRKSVMGTAQYQLSHAGVKTGVHTVTWFGQLAYNKIKVEPEEVDPETCPICGKKLLPVVWLGAEGTDPLGDLPEGEYWVEPGGWGYTARARRY